MFKSGFVNIVGNPNVGKSTLMNLLVGERISIATFKAQTTRHRIMGILNTPEMQICFSDTPGVLKPNYKLQEQMLQFSESALQDADVLLYVTDMVETPDKNADFLSKVGRMKVPVLVLVNKIDLLLIIIAAFCSNLGKSINGNLLSTVMYIRVFDEFSTKRYVSSVLAYSYLKCTLAYWA